MRRFAFRHPVALVEKFTGKIVTERRFLDDAGNAATLVASCDSDTGRLDIWCQRSWAGDTWRILTMNHGMPVSRMNTVPGRYETHYRFNQAKWNFEKRAN